MTLRTTTAHADFIAELEKKGDHDFAEIFKDGLNFADYEAIIDDIMIELDVYSKDNLEKAIIDLNDRVNDSKEEIATLEDTIEELEKAHEGLEKENTDLSTQIEDLQEQLKEQAK